MGKIDEACKKVVESTDGAAACGVVDLESGMLLGVHNSSNYSAKLNDVLAAATLDMFRGSSVSRIEKMVRQHRGAAAGDDHYLEEIHITSRNNHHFAKCIARGRAVLVLVTKRTTSAGMGWAQLKAALASIESLIP